MTAQSVADPKAAPAAPLDDVMLAMDVVDTLRHREDLALRELDESAREKQLLSRLRDIYHQQGIEVSDDILREGVSALRESRFVYTPPQGGWQVALARLYVTRARWGKWALGIIAAAILAIGGYALVYQPIVSAQTAQARIELAEGIPAQLEALYQTVYEETKVQQAVVEAEAIRTRGLAFAREGNREGAVRAVADLTDLRDRLRQQYTLRVVNRQGVDSGFWTFPEINTAATNYYLVVEALDPDGAALTLPVLNEETGTVDEVAVWGLRVPESVYQSVAADKLDDGIIQRNEVGRKSEGFLEVEYAVPVLGGAVTQW